MSLYPAVFSTLQEQNWREMDVMEAWRPKNLRCVVRVTSGGGYSVALQSGWVLPGQTRAAFSTLGVFLGKRLEPEHSACVESP